MSELSIFLEMYFLGSLIYWISYILLRPHISRSHKHLLLFLANMFLGFILITYLPINLYLTGEINHPLVLVLGISMGLSLALHHFGFLKDIQPWKGFITPKNEKVPLIHGAISHLLFSTSYLIYGFVLVNHYSQKVSSLTEKIILYPFFFWIEMVAIIVLYDGIRMCYKEKT